MKKILLGVVLIIFVLSFGCATKDYVKQQIEPLADRISKLESKTAMHDRQIEEVKRMISDCCEKADSAAKRAENAAIRAEAAAERAAKAFKLGQKK